MEPRPRKSGSDAEPVRIALEHAVRRWESELENDRKLTHRENGLLTLVAAVLGLGLFKLEVLRGGRSVEWGWIVPILFLVSLVLMFVSLAKVLLLSKAPPRVEPLHPGARARPIQLASGYLRWPEDPDRPPSNLATAREASLLACELTTRAATSLYFRNLERSKTLDSSQRYLLGSAFVAAWALVCYAWGNAG